MLREIYQPNYLTPQSRKAETDFDGILDRAQDIGLEVQKVNPDITPSKILSLLEQIQPERLKLVQIKLKEKGINIKDLNLNELLDKALGIDFLFRFKDKVFAVDVASGNANTLLNKGEKIRSFEDIYKKIGIDKAIVIRIRDEITDDLLIDFLFKPENEIRENPENFFLEFRYNKPQIH